jgi:hypothetical protein
MMQELSIDAMPKMIRSNVLRNLDKFPNLRKLGTYSAYSIPFCMFLSIKCKRNICAILLQIGFHFA